MRKFLIILFIVPALATVAHDVYIYSQAPEKGFHFSDLGALWDKYHKSSHDQWKSKLRMVEGAVSDIDIIEQKFWNEQEAAAQDRPKAHYEDSFVQTNEQENAKALMTSRIVEPPATPEPTTAESWIGTLLKQKAALVLLGICGYLIILMRIIGFIFKDRSSDNKKLKRGSKKLRAEKAYEYKRK